MKQEHLYQRILKKSEIKDILNDMWYHENLVYCIVHGKSDCKYQERLMLSCQKLAIVSSMFYVNSKGQSSKLPEKEYVRFFDNYLEDVEEARLRIRGVNGDEALAEYLYKKYGLIKQLVLPLLIDTTEVWYAYEFRTVIEYALSHDNFFGDDVKKLLNFADKGTEYGNFYI